MNEMEIKRHTRYYVLLHIVVWAALFFSPLLFVGNEQISIGRFIRNSVVPLVSCVVFYLNYFFLAPQYLQKDRRRRFWISNILMILVLSSAMHAWFEYSFEQDVKAGLVKKRHAKEHPERRMFFMLRDIMNLAIAATTATAIVISRKWNEAEEARKEAETARTEAELNNLRNQVNPHFLLNTLNNIYALTAFNKEKAQAAILELSNMLRHMLYDNQQPYVPLTDEIKFMHNYIALMKIRLADNVKVTEVTDIPDNCDIQVAPLIFISLIENAFKHGISPSEDSFINISTSAGDGKITCHIENSNHPKTQSDRSGHGIGLQQVEKRLNLSYKGKHEWTRGVTADNTYVSEITLFYDA